MTGQKLEQVELVDGEYVVAHGTSRVAWLVRQGEAWVASRQVPGCRVAARDAGPGTIWETAVTLEVPRGTELVRVERRPRPRGRGRDPFDFLGQEIRSAERLERRTQFTVGPHGTLRRRS